MAILQPTFFISSLTLLLTFLYSLNKILMSESFFAGLTKMFYYFFFKRNFYSAFSLDYLITIYEPNLRALKFFQAYCFETLFLVIY
jgi:hypothetical protein